MNKKTIPERSADTRLCISVLKEMSPGERISYEKISEKVGFDVKKKHSPLRSARTILLREERKFFGTEWGKGVKLLTEKETAQSASHRSRRIGNQAKMGVRELESIQDFNVLSTTERTTVFTYSSLYGLIRDATKQRKIKKIENVVKKAQKALPTTKMLEAIKDSLE